jgi:hypothetical protein
MAKTLHREVSKTSSHERTRSATSLAISPDGTAGLSQQDLTPWGGSDGGGLGRLLFLEAADEVGHVCDLLLEVLLVLLEPPQPLLAVQATPVETGPASSTAVVTATSVHVHLLPVVS